MIQAVLFLILTTLTAFTTAQPVDKLTIMSFNLWLAASQVNNGFEKTLNAIKVAQADVVALQESMEIGSRIARALGWHAYAPKDSSLAIISRYPITQTYAFSYNQAGLGARIKLTPDRDFVLWSVHLSSSPYAPYQACLDARDSKDIIRGQHDAQLKEFNGLLDKAHKTLEGSADKPVFFVGDFNTPSHLDWVPEAIIRNCGYTIEYPVTVAAQKAGLKDAYRVYWPDPLLSPGVTWSPIYKNYKYPTGKTEPMDRIDFVYFSGDAVRVTRATTFLLGKPRSAPNHWDNIWPSDHSAVLVDVVLPR